MLLVNDKKNEIIIPFRPKSPLTTKQLKISSLDNISFKESARGITFIT